MISTQPLPVEQGTHCSLHLLITSDRSSPRRYSRICA